MNTLIVFEAEFEGETRRFAIEADRNTSFDIQVVLVRAGAKVIKTHDGFWQDLLNDEQRGHLIRIGATALDQFIFTRQEQRKLVKHAQAKEACWDCLGIARAIGLEV